MKIAILVKQYLPDFGGTEIATYNIALQLAERGHQIYVLTGGLEEASGETPKSNFTVYRFEFPHIPLVGVSFMWLKMVQKLGEIQPDIVHIQDINIGIPGYITQKMFHIPYVIMTQGLDVYSPDSLDRVISRRIFSRAASVIALTRHMKSCIQKTVPREVEVVPNGVDLTPFKAVSRNTHDQSRTILFVGRIVPVKGLDILLEAMESVVRQIPEVTLRIAGVGEEKENLQQQVKKLHLSGRVEFLGMVDHHNIPSLMKNSDIFVLPSLSEGFPLVLVEAMAAGLPIVATDVKGVSEIIEDGVHGFLVKPKDHRGLSEKILLLLNNPTLREEISRNNTNAAEQYGWSAIAERLEKIYQKSLRIPSS
jgi:glycosyltransferase involved in cell wall biosynthesis